MICYSRRWLVLYDAVCCMIIAMLYDFDCSLVCYVDLSDARWMASAIGSSWVPIADAGRLSYYLCMIGSPEYMLSRMAALKADVSSLERLFG